MGNKNAKFMSTVVIGESRYRTFPNEYPTSEMAENAVAKLALEALKKTGDSSSVLTPPMSPSGDAANDDLSQMVDRIWSLVKEKPNGVFSTQIGVEYKRKFNEELPQGWPERIGQNAKIKVEPGVGNGMFIVLPNDQPVETIPTSKVTMPQMNNNNNVKQEQIITESNGKTTNGTTGVSKNGLPNFVFPDEETEFWNVYITCVMSTTCVYLRLLGDQHSALFDDLATEMEMFYFNEKEFPPVSDPKVMEKRKTM